VVNQANAGRIFTGNEAAQESNLPSDGLRHPAGFEDRIGHQAGATPQRNLDAGATVRICVHIRAVGRYRP